MIVRVKFLLQRLFYNFTQTIIIFIRQVKQTDIVKTVINDALSENTVRHRRSPEWCCYCLHTHKHIHTILPLANWESQTLGSREIM